MANDCNITQTKLQPGPNPNDIKTAILKGVDKEWSVRQIALAMNLEKITLQRHVNKYEKLPDGGKKRRFLCPSLQHKTSFHGGARTITEKLSHHFSKNEF